MAINKDIEKQILAQVVDGEYATSYSNQSIKTDEIESIIDMIDLVRSDKKYDWMSDISIPEFASHMLTQSSIDAGQYFQSRDFVETYIQDEGQEALDNAEAAKECINRTLNQKHLHHYYKYMRGKNICNSIGYTYAICWWEQESEERQIGVTNEIENLSVDELGRPITDPDIQVPATRTVEKPMMGEVILKDRFNYDILDPRNVFTDNKYVYSIQEKDWVIIRSEKTYEQLKADQLSMGYFNLEELKKVQAPTETQTSRETYNKQTGANQQETKQSKPVNKYYDILERFGKYWCIIEDWDEQGNPSEVSPGIDERGEIKENAELHEVIMTFALNEGTKKLIRFQLQPYKDAEGNRIKPLVRGICYIHPTSDNGLGDGKFARELQTGINDTFNMSNDRVSLATMPILKGKKYSVDDYSTVYFEPGHMWELENPDDIQEVQISDNIEGAMAQMGMLTNKMQQVTSIYPTTMGSLPEYSGTTATAVAGAEQRTNARTNYKSLTYENTFLSEFYWMILQMTYQFAKEETAFKLMGQKAYNFDPTKDYFYKPVSQTIEPEQSKTLKVQRWTQILGYVTQIGHPDTVKIVNYVLTQMFKYMGDEFVNFSDKLLNPEKPIQPEGAAGGESAQPGVLPSGTSNQYGVQQSAGENNVREATTGGI